MLQKFLKLFELGYPSFWNKNEKILYKIIIIFLLPFSFLFFLVSKFNYKFQKTRKVGIPVICIGNITSGGSGKTPFVVYLAKILEKRKKNVHIITRGYLGKLNGPVKVNNSHTVEEVGDEALLLAKKTTTWVSKNKFDGALMATLDGADIIILDDGLQNKTLYQDLKIMIIDGEFGLGNGLIIPSGPLRENLNSGIKKSDLMVIFNKDLHDIKEKIKNKISYFFANSKIKEFSNLKNKKIVAFSGLGRPEKFYLSLKENKLNVIKFFPFPDHYNYSNRKINELINYARNNNSILVSTLKDKQRISIKQRKKISFLDLDVQLKNEIKFINFLKKKKIV